MTIIEKVILNVVQKKNRYRTTSGDWVNFYLKKRSRPITNSYICVTFFTKITSYNDSEFECWLTCPQKMANKIQEKMNEILNISSKDHLSNQPQPTIILNLRDYPPLALLRKILI